MDILIVSLAALVASALTLFSGFGLGTLLMPVIALFFPIDRAIALTAVVHLSNNLFKSGLLGRRANGLVVLRFGMPAVAASFAGALAMAWISERAPTLPYTVFGQSLGASPIKLLMGLLILVFVLLEASPKFSGIAIDRKYLPFGGLLSGFFGGLSGHQGALRSMFLIKSGLPKEEFVATGVVLAVMVDCARLLIYGRDIGARPRDVDWLMAGSACLSAFVGAYVGARLLGKITLASVQRIVALLLVVIAIGLITGLL